MEITAKDVYLFAEYCTKIQKGNIEFIEKEIADLKNSGKTRKEISAAKKNLINQKRICEEKIEYLHNTQTIVEALYYNFNNEEKFDISDEERSIFESKMQEK